MEKFWLALENELRAQRINTSNMGVNTNGNFQIQKGMAPVKAVKGRHPYSVTGRYLEIKPAGDVAHVLYVDEIWVGYDDEGYDWSDNMGGIVIDCTGMTINQAVDVIVKRMVEKFTEYFSRKH